MEKGTFRGYAVLGITIGLGICVAGPSVSHALFEARASQRYVIVKGLAEQFAKDSESVAGKIRTATQGLFSITGRDMNSPGRKNVRVATTVEYCLSD